LLADVLAEADPSGKLAIEVRGLDPETLPIVGANEVRGSARGIPVEQKTSYWDVIYNVTTRVGLIAFVDGVSVVLAHPKTLTLEGAGKIRTLAWGHNLEHIKLEREHGKEQAPTIVMRGYDVSARKNIEVQYPTGQVDFGKRKPHVNEVKVRGTQTRAKTTEKHRSKPQSKKKKTVTTIKEREEYQIIPAGYVGDRETLLRMAQARYHMIGKSERRVVASTRDLKDMRESDMLDISAGDAVEILWDEFNRELLQNPKVSETEKVEHLVGRGFNRAVAQVIARRYEALVVVDRPLRIKEATLTWDVEEGVNIELELYDFIMVDGIRPDDGAPAPTRADRRDPRDVQGDLIGYNPDERDALKQRYRP
jgi:hypothetical protein